MYTDEDGMGHSFTSLITGGAAGEGHNNVVATSSESTTEAMKIANSMNGKTMRKTIDSLQKDFKSLN